MAQQPQHRLLTEAAAADGGSGDAAAADAPSAAAELNLIIASNQTSADNPYSFGMDKFKEVVEELSGGKISVTVHKGTLGENESELIEAGDGRGFHGRSFSRIHDFHRCSGSRYLLPELPV